MGKVIYVASPYNNPDDDMRYLNYHRVSKYVAKLISKGEVAISPIAYGHPLLNLEPMPYDFGFWSNFCLSILSKCDEIHVLTLDGWSLSRGLMEELKFAEDNFIPVTYVTYDNTNEDGTL